MRQPILVILALLGLAAHAEEIDINVNGVRPVALALDKVAGPLGFLVTYEDPRYAYPGDLRDATAEVSPTAGRGKIFWPIGGTLEVRRLALPTNPDLDAARKVLEKILTVQAQGAGGGRYKVLSAGNMLHVVPTEVRDERGEWIKQTSILDTRISIPPAARSVDAMMVAICQALGTANSLHIIYDAGGSTLMYDGQSFDPVQGADNEIARDVVIRTLARRKPTAGWRLDYVIGASWRGYSLSLWGAPLLDRRPKDMVQPRAIPGTPNSGMTPDRSN